MGLRAVSFRNLAVCFAMAVCSVTARADQDFSAPINHLGNADPDGKLIFWRDLAEVAPETGHSMPLRARFAASPRPGTPLFGRFWYVPLLESSLVNVSEGLLAWQTLGGKLSYLARQKDGSFQSQDGRHVAQATSPSEWLLTSAGWQYRYVSGRLRDVKISDGTELEWVYQGSKLMGIKDRKQGTLLTVEYAADAESPSALIVGKTRLNCAYQKMPVVTDVMGQPMVAGFENSLLSVEGGFLKESYAVSLGQDGIYQMVETSMLNDYTRTASWDGRTGALKEDGKWRYEVKQDPSVGPIVVRTNEKNQVESYYYNTKTGSSEHVKPDGSIVKRTYFEAPGPTYHKIRKAVETRDGKEVAVRQWSYDDLGRLIRDKSGPYERNWSWSADGKLVEESALLGDKVLSKVRYDEAGRPLEKTLKDKTYKYAYEGGKKIVQRMQDGKVLNTRVIDEETGAVAFFTPDPKTGALQGGFSKVLNAVSAKDLEQARALAEHSLQILQSDKSK